MNEWNYDKAKAFVNGIEDSITRTLMLVLLDAVIMQCAYTREKPEWDFDLLFMVKMIAPTIGEHKLLRWILDGKPIDTSVWGE